VVPGVGVNLTGSSYVSVTTNSQGQYSASVPQTTWSIEPAKTGGFGSAVSSLDAARVLQLLAGMQQFTEQQRLACDATGDGTISTLDAVYLLQFSAGLIDHLPVAKLCDSDWLFYPVPGPEENQQIIPPAMVGGACQQGAIVLNPLVGSAPQQNFKGILLGDCTATGPQRGSSRRAGSTTLAGAARQGQYGRFTVPIYVKTASPFEALDLRLQFDTTASFVGATARGDAVGALTSAQAVDGQLSISLASAQPIDDSHGAVVLLDSSAAPTPRSRSPEPWWTSSRPASSPSIGRTEGGPPATSEMRAARLWH
jgi:hypothetical protein